MLRWAARKEEPESKSARKTRLSTVVREVAPQLIRWLSKGEKDEERLRREDKRMRRWMILNLLSIFLDEREIQGSENWAFRLLFVKCFCGGKEVGRIPRFF